MCVEVGFVPDFNNVVPVFEPLVRCMPLNTDMATGASTWTPGTRCPHAFCVCPHLLVKEDLHECEFEFDFEFH